MPSGIKFFGENYNETVFVDNVITPSSNTANAEFAIDNLDFTKWVSSGEGTDGNQISFEIDYSAYTNRTIDSFYLAQTNISDAEFEYWNGSSWVTVEDSVNAVVVKNDDNTYVYAKLSSPVTVTKVRVIGSNTITADEEKEFYGFKTFLELGEFEGRPVPSTRHIKDEEVHQLSDGRYFAFSLGDAFEYTFNFKSMRQVDISLIESLIDAELPIHVWLCGSDTDQFRFSFKPFRFQDLKKMMIVGDQFPNLTQGYYQSAYNNKIKLIEVS